MFFTGFDFPAIFIEDAEDRRNRKFQKHFHRQRNFLTDWLDDIHLYHKLTPAQQKEQELKALQVKENEVKAKQKALEQYLIDLKETEKKIKEQQEQVMKIEVEPKEQAEQKEKKPEGKLKNIFKFIDNSEDEIEKIFKEFTLNKKVKKENKDEKKPEEQKIEEEKKEPNKDEVIITEENPEQPPKLTEQKSAVLELNNKEQLSSLKERLAQSGFECKENSPNDEKNWVVGKKQFVNENNEKEKQVFYQIHDKDAPNCNYSGYTKQTQDDNGNFSSVKKSVYQYSKEN